MHEFVISLIEVKFKKFRLWEIEETDRYVYGRFTAEDGLYMLVYYKPGDQAEIFKLVKEK